MQNRRDTSLWATTSLALLLLTTVLEFYFHENIPRQTPESDQEASDFDSSEPGQDAADSTDQGKIRAPYRDSLGFGAKPANPASNNAEKPKTTGPWRTRSKPPSLYRSSYYSARTRPYGPAFKSGDSPDLKIAKKPSSGSKPSTGRNVSNGATPMARSDKNRALSRRLDDPRFPPSRSKETTRSVLKNSGPKFRPASPSGLRNPRDGRTQRPDSRRQSFTYSLNWDGSRMKDAEPSKEDLKFHKRQVAKKPRTSGHFRQPKPPSLKELLGKRPLRPPQKSPAVPNFSKAEDLASSLKSQGIIPDLSPMKPQDLETLRPPSDNSEFKTWSREDSDGQVHQHDSGANQYWRQGSAWTVVSEGKTAQMIQSRGEWWLLSDDQQPLFWHDGHWWWQSDGLWFLLHEGEPWAYQQFKDEQTEGFLHVESGSRIVYNADGSRAAVLTPGEETVLFDLGSGQEIGRWPPKAGKK